MRRKIAFVGRICAAFSVLLFVLMAKPAFAVYITNTTELDNEFWISTNTSSTNLGTLDNPFICATEPEFDYTMSNLCLVPNSTIHILAGTYQTHGSPSGFLLKTGQKVIGSGIDVTVLQLAPGTRDNTVVIGSLIGTNMEVSDLTCDGNYQGQSGASVTYHGVGLWGTQNAVRRVKVINLAKFGGNTEAWGIVLNNSNLADSEGNIIEECEVSHFQGGVYGKGISAISLNGKYQSTPISGIVRGNRVLLDPSLSNPEVAFNGNWIHDCLYEGNYVNGATFGYYGDTGGSTDIIVTHNTFKNVFQGISQYNSSRQNMTFSYNTILLTINTTTQAKLAFNFSDTWFTNFNILGNTVSWNSPPPSGSAGYFLDLDDISGLLVANNRVDPTLVNGFVGSDATNNYVFQNNYDLNGNQYLSTNRFSILFPDAYVQQYGGGTVSPGELISINGNGFFAWLCPSNANAALDKSLPLPNDFWGGKRTFISSWKVRTTVAGSYSFSIGEYYALTNDIETGLNQTITFTAASGTKTTTVTATNTISTANVNYLHTFIYLGNKTQPGNYSILGGSVYAQ